MSEKRLRPIPNKITNLTSKRLVNANSQMVLSSINATFKGGFNDAAFCLYLSGSRCIKGADESISRVDSPVPLMHHDPDRSCRITDPDPGHSKGKHPLWLRRRPFCKPFSFVGWSAKTFVFHFFCRLDFRIKQSQNHHIYSWSRTFIIESNKARSTEFLLSAFRDQRNLDH